jgi:hypothetical protein
MGEGHVYLCGWRVEDETYHIWVQNHPRLRARGDSLDDASEELVRLICRSTGDGEAVLDLDPLPGGHTAFVALGTNSSWNLREGITRDECATLYEGGICDVCCHSVGERTEVPLPLGMVGEGDFQFFWAMFCDAVIASDRLRRLLTPRERAAFDWHPVDQSRRLRRTFFELAAKQPVHEVADRKEQVDGWRCPRCKRRVFCICGKFNPHIAADDVPQPLPKVLAISGHWTRVALPIARWRALRGQAGAKGTIAKPVTVLPPSRALRQPRLRTLTRAQIHALRGQFEWQLAGGN